MAEVGTEIVNTSGEGAEDQTDMGQCCSAQCCPCFRHREGYEPIVTVSEEPTTGYGSFFRKKDWNVVSSKYAWEQNTLKENLTKFDDTVSHATIVSYSDGALRAVAPETFRPDRKGIVDILSALKGDVTGLAENGINLGGDSKMSTPGKLEEGSSIFGSDAQGGGCTVLKTKECLLIVIYVKDPAPTNRLAREVADYMIENEK